MHARPDAQSAILLLDRIETNEGTNPFTGIYVSSRNQQGNERSGVPSVKAGVVVPELERDGWWPARLIAPLRHSWAERVGPAGQRAFLERLLAESWWRSHVGEVRVLATRIPAEWGVEYHLYGNSMNPVMTARLMRAGRLAHRSPYVRGLYLAGSATHPGQWVSFCAISGILAADCLREDFA